MTNKEKLEVIDKVLDGCYETININFSKTISKGITTNFKDITQAIYNLESTKLLLEPIENNLGTEKIYILEIKDADDGEELNTFAFYNLEDFNKARNLINHWKSTRNGYSIKKIFEENNIKLINYIYDSISI